MQLSSSTLAIFKSGLFAPPTVLIRTSEEPPGGGSSSQRSPACAYVHENTICEDYMHAKNPEIFGMLCNIATLELSPKTAAGSTKTPNKGDSMIMPHSTPMANANHQQKSPKPPVFCTRWKHLIKDKARLRYRIMCMQRLPRRQVLCAIFEHLGASCGMTAPLYRVYQVHPAFAVSLLHALGVIAFHCARERGGAHVCIVSRRKK
jgi:hypothetical protein